MLDFFKVRVNRVLRRDSPMKVVRASFSQRTPRRAHKVSLRALCTMLRPSWVTTCPCLLVKEKEKSKRTRPTGGPKNTTSERKGGQKKKDVEKEWNVKDGVSEVLQTVPEAVEHGLSADLMHFFSLNRPHLSDRRSARLLLSRLRALSSRGERVNGDSVDLAPRGVFHSSKLAWRVLWIPRNEMIVVVS